MKDLDVKKAVKDAVEAAKNDAKKELDKWDSKVSCLGKRGKKNKDKKKDKKLRKAKKKAAAKKHKTKNKKSKKRRRESTTSSSSSSDEEDESEEEDENDENDDDESSDMDDDGSKTKSSKTKKSEFWNKFQKKVGQGQGEHESAPSIAPSSQDGRGSVVVVDEDLFSNPRFSPQPSIPELQDDMIELLNAVENKYIALDSVIWLNLKWESAGAVSGFFAIPF